MNGDDPRARRPAEVAFSFPSAGGVSGGAGKSVPSRARLSPTLLRPRTQPAGGGCRMRKFRSRLLSFRRRCLEFHAAHAAETADRMASVERIVVTATRATQGHPASVVGSLGDHARTRGSRGSSDTDRVRRLCATCLESRSAASAQSAASRRSACAAPKPITCSCSSTEWRPRTRFRASSTSQRSSQMKSRASKSCADNRARCTAPTRSAASSTT